MKWNDFTQSYRYKNQIRPIVEVFKVLIWYGFLIFIGWKVYEFQTQYQISEEEVKEVLPNIISTMGIMNAILITFIFSKLYAEKSEIISRKKRIQQLSKKLNALKKITFILFKKNQFYKFKEDNQAAKSLNPLYEINLFIKDVDDNYIKYNIFNPTVYKLDDLAKIYNSFKGLFGYSEIRLNDFNTIDNYSLANKEVIEKNLKVINETDTIKELNKESILYSLNDYFDIFLNEHYILIELNSSKARSYFNYLLADLIVSIVLIIIGMLLISSSASSTTLIVANKLIIAIFIALVIDILKNIISAIRFEFKAYGIKEN